MRPEEQRHGLLEQGAEDAQRPVERLVNWRDNAKQPLCAAEDNSGWFEILIDDPVFIEVPIYTYQHGEKRRHDEYYVATVSGSGEMEDMGENGLGFDWNDVSRWCLLSELIAS